MASWVTGRSIRIKLMFLLLAVLLPAAGIVAWLLAADLRDARDAAYANVKILSTNTAEDLTRFLSQSEAAMATLAARPRVKSLAPDDCDPIIAEYIGLNPQFDALAVGDLQGRIVCSYPQAPAVQPSAMESAWYEAGLRSDGLRASDAFVQPGSKRWATVLSYPIRNDGGSTIGLLVLPVDLLRLSAQLLASVPRHAVVSVVDRQRRILVRSAAIESFIGTRRNAAEPDPLKDLREGFVSARGRDGVQRLVSVVTVPGTGWIVAAGLPEAEAFAPYDRLVLRTAGIGVGLVLVILVIAWRLSNSIVRPISTLAAAAAQVAAGDTAVRVQVAGPVEVESVARQFNRMLDARDLSEARLRGIFESATDAIITLDETQTIVMANPAAARMFRCPVGTLVGAPYERFVPRGDRADHAREIQAPGEASVGAHRMPVPGEAIGLRADGDAFPLDAAISHLMVSGHRLYTAIIRDITEQRRAEAALRESEAHLRDLLTMLPEAVVVNTDDRITFVNEAAQRLFGADEAALIGRSAMDLIHPDSVDLVKARNDALKAGATTLPLAEEKVLCADGSTRLVEATATLLQDKGRSSILAVKRDVTDLRHALSALEDAHADLQRLYVAHNEVQETERKRIARELHDDLQQTLGAIKMNVGAIGEALQRNPAAARPILAEIDELTGAAIDSSRRIVNDLRPQMLEDLGLAPSLEALAGQFSRRYGIACRFDAPSAVDDDDDDDELDSLALTTCLFRVTQEGLNNVAKHAHATAVQIVLTRTADRRLLLRIHDNGIGMRAADERKPGSFGLRGIHERVRALGGVVRIVGDPGSGTTIEVEVPLAELQEAERD